jgi:magnesium-protoporphyrin O-methyltransferase
MQSAAYLQRRGQLQTYFDRTAASAWERLTSDAPVSRIRATVRAGRNRMRALLLDLLPMRLDRCRVLDAGCGTGALAQELADRGADVLAIDLSPTLIDLARKRCTASGEQGIEFRSGDMCEPALGQFDYVVAMDSLIHYDADDIVRVLSNWAPRIRCSMLFTFAPRTPALALMHSVGRVFPRGDRAPAIAPVAEAALRARLARSPELADWTIGACERIASGFYTSQALELVRR